MAKLTPMRFDEMESVAWNAPFGGVFICLYHCMDKGIRRNIKVTKKKKEEEVWWSVHMSDVLQEV